MSLSSHPTFHAWLASAPSATRRICVSASPICLALICLACVPLRPAAAETWVDLNETRTIEADLVGLWNDNVILEMGGRRYTVPMMWFRSDSRIQAQNLWEQIKRDRKTRAEEFQGQAAASEAPAPDPIPTPPAAPAYQPPVAGGSCQDFLQHLDKQLAGGHLLIIYDSLPPQYRRDVEDLTKLAAAKTDPLVWRAAFQSVHQLGDLLITRQNWFFSQPRIVALEDSQLTGLEDRWLLLAGVLQQGFDPQWFDPAKIQNSDFRQWLTDIDKAMAPYVAALIEQQSVGDGRQFTVESENAQGAVVSMSQAGTAKRVSFVNIDGYWVPKQMADAWPDSVAALRADLEQGNPNNFVTQRITVLASLNAVVGPLASAVDASDFHNRMETMIEGSREQIASLANTLGVTLASNDPASRRRGGYGEEDMYEEDMYGEDMYEEDMEDMYEEEGLYGDEMMEEDMDMEMEEDYAE